jgi:hypothetical protein
MLSTKNLQFFHFIYDHKIYCVIAFLVDVFPTFSTELNSAENSAFVVPVPFLIFSKIINFLGPVGFLSGIFSPDRDEF